MIKIGLKSNAAFLWDQMNGDTLGGTDGGVYWRAIMHVTEQQFAKFKRVLVAFGGDLAKSLTATTKHSFRDEVDYECYFVKLN